MAQTNYTPISLYYSTTASAVPTAANLVQGELAINTADGKLYYEDSAGVVQVLATKSTGLIGGSNTQVQFNNSGSLGGSSGLTWDGSFLTTSSIKNSALTSGRVTYAGASGLLSDSSSFVFDGNNLGLGVAAGGTTRLSVTASSGSLATFQQTGATGYGVTIVPGADTTYDAFTINNAANTLNKIRMFGNGNATFAGNVGIGTSSPSALAANYTTVDIRGSAGGALRFGNTTDSAYMYSDSNETNIATATNQRMIFTINTAEKMRLDTSGNLGLGVTPSAWAAGRTALEIGGSTTGNIAFNGNATNGYQIWCNSYFNAGSNFYYANGLATNFGSGSGSFFWNIAPNNASGAGAVATFTQAMTLNADGQLLLGTTSVFNSAYTMSLKVSGSTGGLIIQPGADSYTAIQFNNAAGSGVGSISVSSTLTSYNVTSDQRLKTNIVDAPSSNIDNIKVRSFDWIADGSHQEYGMVAQELIEVAPYAVTKPVNPDEMMSVDYSKLVPMMIKEIQDLKQRIATLENK